MSDLHQTLLFEVRRYISETRPEMLTWLAAIDSAIDIVSKVEEIVETVRVGDLDMHYAGKEKAADVLDEVRASTQPEKRGR